MNFAAFVLPISVGVIVLSGLISKIKVFDAFTEGAKQGFETFVNLLPVLTGLVLAVNMLNASGGVDVLQKIISPVTSLFGIPDEVIPLCILSPVSGSGSLSVFESIISEYGVDSFVGRIASVIAGSTETTFYAAAVYLGSVGIKKSGALIPCALMGDMVSFIAASLTVKMMF